MRPLLIPACLTLLLAAAAAGESLVIAGPDTRAAIVIHDNWEPSRWYDWGGHKILQRFVEVITEQKLPIVKAGDLHAEAYDVRIFIGRQPRVDAAIGAQLDLIDDDGYIIHADGSNVYLAGKYWWGDNWVAHDLLERFADCRWYLMEPRFWRPDVDGLIGPGDIIPQTKTIAIPAGAHIVEEPDYKARWFRIAPMHSFRLRSRDHFHHAMVRIIPPDTFDAHPEWFPLVDGQRHRPTRGHDFQPCASNPRVVEHVADAAVAYFEKSPHESTFSIGMNDSNVFCECEPCLAIAPPSIEGTRARIAYAFFDFYNRIAERVTVTYPNKRLGCLAYAGLRALPLGSIELHPMIVPYLTVDSAQLHETAQRAEFAQSTTKWDELTGRMGIYEYMYGGGFVIPRIYNRYLFPNIKNRYGVNTDGFYAEAYPNWGLDGPKYWVAAKLLWDTSLDPDALLAQFYSDMFGPAGDAMCDYFDHLEEVWCTQTLESDRSNYRWLRDPRQLAIFSPDDCDKAWTLLERALTAAPDEKVRDRIDYFRTSFNVSRILCKRAAHANRADELMKDDNPRHAAAAEQLQQWLSAGDLAAAVEAARNIGFSAFSTTADDELDNIGMYDNQPNVAVERLILEAADAAARGGSVDEHISQYATGNAATFLSQLARRRAMVVFTDLTQPPAVDGVIEPSAWGEPFFDGHFHNYAHARGKSNSLLQTFAPERTRVWAARCGDKLYLAFDCEQEPDTIGANIVDNDTTAWRNPDMRRDDCIALTFKARGYLFQSLRVNANGATSDFQGGELDWDVITAAAVRRTENGWQAELEINAVGPAIGPGVELDRNPRFAIARYTRRPHPREKDEFDVVASTLMPFAAGKGVIGHGNSPNLMVFGSGAVPVYPAAE